MTDIAEVQLIFGPNIAAPKEIYCLHFPSPPFGCEKFEDISEKKHKECLRRSVRSYIQHWAEVINVDVISPHFFAIFTYKLT